jgi:hypothetical protein
MTGRWTISFIKINEEESSRNHSESFDELRQPANLALRVTLMSSTRALPLGLVFFEWQLGKSVERFGFHFFEFFDSSSGDCGLRNPDCG